MGSIILVTGGARSGKSAIAESRTLVFGSPAVYVATAQALDAEMAQRNAAHQARRVSPSCAGSQGKPDVTVTAGGAGNRHRRHVSIDERNRDCAHLREKGKPDLGQDAAATVS